MSINHALLGILSSKSLTGYDLKKIIQESPFMHWSGNNNQIYKALVELLEEGFVTSETYYQESSPPKKVYTITQEGLAELKEWVLSAPEPPELKKTFLIQLAWSDQLKTEELDSLLSEYENQIQMQILMQREKQQRGIFSPGRNPREEFIWKMIYENIIASYETELKWLEKIRSEILIGHKEETRKMNYKVNVKDSQKYIECLSVKVPLDTEQDALDLIAVCGENDTNLLMLHAEVFSDDFFKLRTGLAGKILQKLVNYQVRTAMVIPDELMIRGKFRDFIAETNKGNHFRVFTMKDEAEKWLIKSVSSIIAACPDYCSA
ncbi:MAG: DUF4180 domain-containing protein [Peptococcaceae bacterium]|nr:DUF4180 domain-containing protein [Peptococcaceae bacterium]